MHSVKSRKSYGDLLQLVLEKNIDPEDSNAIAKVAHSLGFEEAETVATSPIKNAQTSSEFTPSKKNKASTTQNITGTSPSERPLLPFHHIVKRERLEHHLKPKVFEKVQWLEEMQPLASDEIYDKNARKPQWQALTRSPKLWAKLRQILKQQYESSTPDIPKLVKHIESGSLLKQIPFTSKYCRVSQLLVLVDYASHLRTSRTDYQQLQRNLHKVWGGNRISWQKIEDYPGGKVSINQRRNYQEKKWSTPPVDTAILILSDCGVLADSSTMKRWQAFLKKLKKAGNTLLLLAPVSADNLQGIDLKGVHAYSWDNDLARSGGVTNRELSDDKASNKKDVEKLLAFLSFTYRIEPQLLRASRKYLGLTVSTEAACRVHEDIEDDGEFLYIKPEVLSKYRKLFSDGKTLASKQQMQAIRLVKDAHAVFPRSILDSELVTAQSLMPEQEIAGANESLHYLRRRCKTFTEKSDDRLYQSFVYHYLLDQEKGGEEAALLWTTLYKDFVNEDGATLPKNVNLSDVARFIDINQLASVYRLEQQGKQLTFVKQEEGSGTGQQINSFALAKSEFTQSLIEVNRKTIPLKDEITLDIGTEKSITIDTGTENLTIATLTKPEWAENIGRDEQGLYLEANHQNQLTRVYYPTWGGSLELDEDGIYTEISIKGITQRFRYIAAGTFMMGSPESEIDRLSNETQHEVTLSESYWLADTTCTQELWQAVMGGNPARFNDDLQNPVEQVSWDDVQGFIKKLNESIPELSAQLPTEAQWEYACRAGTSTPFSFGENITAEQANYDGNYPYAKGKKGRDRNKTVPVTALAKNVWGLYQMHGNVWEWCQDWYGTYSSSPVQNPKGADSGKDRVLRGGSWFNDGKNLRSAYRDRDSADFRYSYIGFRLSLGQAKAEAIAEVDLSDISFRIRQGRYKAIDKSYVTERRGLKLSLKKVRNFFKKT